MIKITSDGRKLGLDPRLIDPSFEDNPDTKLNRCVENVARIHAETAEDRLTQIIFCDLGVPHKAAEAAVEGEDADDAKDKKSIAEVESLEEECDFCVYDDIRDKLIAKGIPAEEIAYIHDAKTEQQKADLFDKGSYQNSNNNRRQYRSDNKFVQFSKVKEMFTIEQATEEAHMTKSEFEAITGVKAQNNSYLILYLIIFQSGVSKIRQITLLFLLAPLKFLARLLFKEAA